MNGNEKFHKRHLRVETPCHLHELENLIRTIGDMGYWDTAKIVVDKDDVVIFYGDEEK